MKTLADVPIKWYDMYGRKNEAKEIICRALLSNNCDKVLSELYE